MSADEAAFLNAIIEEPGEDTHRLVYADWLQEHGRPERAEFIRLQCRLEGADAHEDLEDLEDRKDELLDRHGEEWASDYQVRGVQQIRFCRGFVESLTATGSAFLTHQAAWFRRAPLRELTLTKVVGRAGAIGHSPHLRRLVGLSVHDGRFNGSDLVGLVGARGTEPRFPQLEVLSVSPARAIDSNGIAAFAAVAELPRLRDLTLEYTQIDDRGVADLTEAAGLCNLASLSLPWSQVGDDGLLALLDSRRLALSDLSLFNCAVTGAGVESMADVRGRLGFESLDLGANPIGEFDVDQLAVIMEKYPNLRLNLLQCPIPRPLREEVQRRFGERVFVDNPDPPRQRRRITG
jgi:uncharacterized protein (TIGR02996 family)